MTTLIEASGQNASVQAMWALVAVLVIGALWLSVRIIRRARWQSRDLDDRVGRVVADGERVMANLTVAHAPRPNDTSPWLNVDAIEEEHERFRLDDARRAFLNGWDFHDNPIIGFDDDGDAVYLSDFVDGNINLDDVRTTGGGYYPSDRARVDAFIESGDVHDLLGR